MDAADGLTVRKENPKTVGSAAHARYEMYKTAKTVGEYLSLGGTRADLRYDKVDATCRAPLSEGC